MTRGAGTNLSSGPVSSHIGDCSEIMARQLLESILEGQR
jgi:hypothetical protein